MTHWHGLAFVAGAVSWHWASMYLYRWVLGRERLFDSMIRKVPDSTLRWISLRVDRELGRRGT